MPHSEAQQHYDKPVTIIMRAKNSGWVIHQALAALASQTFRNYTLIVVDSGSTDTTLAQVSHYQCQLVKIPAENYYPGTVLNNAIALANTELVVFLNSDAVMLEPQSLQNLLDSFTDDRVMGAYGRQLPRPEADTWVRRDYRKSFPDNSNAPAWLGLSLPLAAIRKSLWEQHPFYSDAWASEDTEWGLWAKRHGYRIDYVPSALLMHSHNYTFRQLYGRRFVEGEADAFIHDATPRLMQMAWRTAKSIVRDSIDHLQLRDWHGLLITPARCSVYAWAHYRGLKHGRERINSGNANTQHGQQVVLARYQ